MYLSDDFISLYRRVEPPFGGNGLGHFVYLRTYSRWLPEYGRREHWYETCRRVVEYSMGLYQGPATYEQLQSEAEQLFDAMFYLKAFPAGRTLWVGGTESAYKNPTSQFNCSFVVLDEVKKFGELFYNLMLGCGVGFRVLFEDVEKLPKLNTKIVLANKPYNPKPKDERIEDTLVYEGDGSVLIVVGDSRNGWVSALDTYFKTIVRSDIESIVVNYDSVRPYGEPLKTFGGRASGHSALRDLFRNIHRTIQSSTDGKLVPVNVLDIANIIGYYVVVGGVRRTSEICLFSPDDLSILNAKVGLWEEGHENFGKVWRSMSNNSVYFTEKPTREYLRFIMESIQQSAEPGFINAEASSVRRPNYGGTNPCAEILLADRGFCNLSEISMPAFIRDDGTIDFDDLTHCLRLATRVGLRMTNVTLELPEWDIVQKRDRLIGPSIDGWEDAVALLKATEATTVDIDQLKQYMRNIVHQEVIAYAHEMRIPIPLLSTCIKPSGTLAQLPTTSSGVHKSFAPYFIRRVRISSSDSLAKAMLELGYPVYPENGQGPSVEEFNRLSRFDQTAALQNAQTWVVEFPVKTSATQAASEESALDQFNRYLSFQRNWSDHNTSVTIQVGDEEWESLFDAIYEHWDEYIGVSFLPKSNMIYPQMPYEEITKEEYERRLSYVVNGDLIVDTLNRIEGYDMATDLLDADCESGVCPPR